MNVPIVVGEFVKEFNREIQSLPQGFYDTFDFTKTGNNFTHPRTVGLIAKILQGLMGTCYVDIDFRYNIGDTKFQPDAVAVGADGPILYVDYESPNSSDARIPDKDVIPYLNSQISVPYIIITTLPKKESPKWQLRYDSKGRVNEGHRANRDIIRINPFKYWYSFYNKKLRKNEKYMGNIFFINVNGQKAQIETVF